VNSVRMPLLQFDMQAESGLSLGHGLSIDRFSFNDAYRLPLFSEQDIAQMRSARWALRYAGDELAAYRSRSNTLLAAFRVVSPYHPPFFKFRLASVPERSTRINQPMTCNYVANRIRKPYSMDDLEAVRLAFHRMLEMDSLSTRTHNALYFLYRAYHADKWIDSFLLMTGALEALFSKDAPGGATAAITDRVASFLESVDRCTKSDVADLYELRSSMTHGRIVVSDDPGENLAKLEHLELVTNFCFRKLLESKKYSCFRTKTDRNAFMGTLNVAL